MSAQRTLLLFAAPAPMTALPKKLAKLAIYSTIIRLLLNYISSGGHVVDAFRGMLFPLFFSLALAGCKPIPQPDLIQCIGPGSADGCCVDGLCQSGTSCTLPNTNGAKGVCGAVIDKCACGVALAGGGPEIPPIDQGPMGDQIEAGKSFDVLVALNRTVLVPTPKLSQVCSKEEFIEVPVQGEIVVNVTPTSDRNAFDIALRKSSLKSSNVDVPCFGESGPLEIVLAGFAGTGVAEDRSVEVKVEGMARQIDGTISVPFKMNFSGILNKETGFFYATYDTLEHGDLPITK